MISTRPSGPDDVGDALAAVGYLPDQGLSTVVHLALTLGRPLLLEGEAGVGKTSLARAVADIEGGGFIRLQCHEGIDVGQAVYQWDHARQLVHLRTAEVTGELSGRGSADIESDLYSERFLRRGPVLEALSAPAGSRRPVLLIDEIDRADDEFDALLLEALSEFSVTVPELGTIRAEVIPIVILTSNRTRDVHDALKRRCLYHWIEHPDYEREVAIVTSRAPQVPIALARQIAALVEHLRGLGLYKPPGVSETIDWAQAIATLGMDVTTESVRATLGAVVKYREDRDRVDGADVDAMVDASLLRAATT